MAFGATSGATASSRALALEPIPHEPTDPANPTTPPAQRSDPRHSPRQSRPTARSPRTRHRPRGIPESVRRGTFHPAEATFDPLAFRATIQSDRICREKAPGRPGLLWTRSSRCCSTTTWERRRTECGIPPAMLRNSTRKPESMTCGSPSRACSYAKGAGMAFLQYVMGHADPRTTMRYYVGMFEDEVPQAVSDIDKWYAIPGVVHRLAKPAPGTLHNGCTTEPKTASQRRTGQPRKPWLTCEAFMAGVTGLEPATSGLTGQRSNQLSYTPMMGRCRCRQRTRFYRARAPLSIPPTHRAAPRLVGRPLERARSSLRVCFKGCGRNPVHTSPRATDTSCDLRRRLAAGLGLRGLLCSRSGG